jgi:hypothetical protein
VDGYRSIAHFQGNITGAVAHSGKTISITHPGMVGEVGHEAIDVAHAAATQLQGRKAHPFVATVELGMIACIVGNDLVGAGEILVGFEIIIHRAKSGIEYGIFDPVAVFGISGNHVQISKGPGHVGNHTGFVHGPGILVAVEIFGGTDHAVNNHIIPDSFVKVDGKITGTFTGENYFGGEITALMIEAESLEIGGYDDIYAPAESTKEVGATKEQHGVSVTLDRIEYAKGEARVYVTVKNESGATASIYTFNAKAIQDGKQFDHQDNYEAGSDNDIGEVLDGASKEGIIRFKALDPGKGFKLTMEAYSDNWEIELEDFVFEVE